MGKGVLLCCGSSLFLKKIYGTGYTLTFEKDSVSALSDEKLVDTIKGKIPTASILSNYGTELKVQLPFDASSMFESLLRTIDGDMQGFGLRSYGISVTTLEEVFLRIASGGDPGRSKEGPVVPVSHDAFTVKFLFALVQLKLVMH